MEFHGVFAICCIIMGLAAIFVGKGFSRVIAFLTGCFGGGMGVYWIFATHSGLQNDGIAIILGMLGACVGGVIALIMCTLSLGCVWAFSTSTMIIAVDNGHAFAQPNYRLVLNLALAVMGIGAALTRKDFTHRMGTITTGSFILVLGLDYFAGSTLASVAFNGTLLEAPLGVQYMLLPTCGSACYVLSSVWVVEILVGLLFHTFLGRIKAIGKRRRRTQAAAMLDENGIPEVVKSYETRKKHDHSAAPPFSQAGFNYFSDHQLPETMNDLTSNLRTIFGHLLRQFGFQKSSTENQLEHLLFLLSNHHSRGLSDPAAALHTRVFGNYRTWCDHLNVAPNVVDEGQGGPEADVQRIEEIALFLLVWGEASNLRFMPECLCFVFHQAAEELHSSIVRAPGQFLQEVITPMYEILKAEKGDIHTKKRNYDDLNEFFWSQNCLQFYYANLSFNPSFRRDSHPSTLRSPVSEGLKEGSKTYIEDRCWLHIIYSFFRVYSFLLIGLHVMVCIAFTADWDSSYDAPTDIFTKQTQVLSSVVLSLSLLTIMGELFGLCLSYTESKYAGDVATGSILRLMIKAMFFLWLTLFYIWSWSRGPYFFNIYLVICAVFMAPHVLGGLLQVCPSAENALRGIRIPGVEAVLRLWNPLRTLYVGKNVGQSEMHVYKYQLYWLSMLSLKFLVSYKFQIQPLVTPTINLLYSKHDLQHDKVTPGVSYFLIISTWAPFILVYVFDLMIWYALWQAITGAIVGMADKLGEVRKFSTLISVFHEAPAQFEAKMVHLPAEQSAREALDRAHAPDKANKYHTPTWHRFSLVWNEVIVELRRGDLLDDDEQHLLLFRFREDTEQEYYLPQFLTVGVLDHALDTLVLKGTEHAREATAEGQARVEKELYMLFDDALSREAIAEMWELGFWVVSALLGPRHLPELLLFNERLFSGLSEVVLLSTLEMNCLPTLKTSFLKLIRGLRIAMAAYKKNKLPSEDSPKAESPSPTSGGMSKVPSMGTLSMLETIQNHARYQNRPKGGSSKPNLHVNLLRDQARDLVNNMCGLVKENGDPEALEAVQQLQAGLVEETGFHWDDDYAILQVRQLLSQDKCKYALRTLYTFLTISKIDAQPRSAEAQRRLLFFTNSLFMDLPKAPSVGAMKSWTVLTPFYSEDIVYSYSDLEKETEDGVSTFLYLQTIYPHEWKNFCQRVGVPVDAQSAAALAPKERDAARQWATARGQTLGRTCNGMMLYEKGLRLMGHIEDPEASSEQLAAQALQKFQYVISAQVYGRQKREMDPKAQDIDNLLKQYPSLRIAYIDSIKVQSLDDTGTARVVDEFYSVLIKSVHNKDGSQDIQEVFRLKLPGNPIVGEGKPENQNHAIVFSRGEMLQAIDMNQENYFEEAIKMRNMLEEFDAESTKSHPCTIVGLREHIFTGSLSSVANYMALQERCFVSLGQRVLHNPLRMRLHYGHPDVFDKLWFCSRGGISKASKGINLSEDIFAGYNAVLRGSYVSMKEYIQVGKGRDVGLPQLFQFEAKLAQGAAMQCMSRDVFRLAHTLDFFRCLSFYFAGLGFYISNSLTIWALYLFLYARLFLASFHFQDVHSFSGVDTISYWIGQIGFLLTLPIYATLGVDHGFSAATAIIARMIFTGGPLFFIFHMGTKAHFFEQTILAGGAKYRPTGRGFVTSHEDFGRIYRFHAYSHFYKAFEILLLLVLYYICAPSGTHYASITWSGWFIAAAWLFAPFWFNPMAFQWDKTVADYRAFMLWMCRAEGSEERCWRTWWKEETAYLVTLTWGRKLFLCALALRHGLVGFALFTFNGSSLFEICLSASMLLIVLFLWVTLFRSESLIRVCVARGFKALSVVGSLVGFIIFISLYRISSQDVSRCLLDFVGLIYCVVCLSNILLRLGVRGPLVESVERAGDYTMALVQLSVLGLLSMAVLPSMIQTRLMFHNAFSRGVLINQLLKGKDKSKPTPVAVPATPAPTPLEGDRQEAKRRPRGGLLEIPRRKSKLIRSASGSMLSPRKEGL